MNSHWITILHVTGSPGRLDDLFVGAGHATAVLMVWPHLVNGSKQIRFMEYLL